MPFLRGCKGRGKGEGGRAGEEGQGERVRRKGGKRKKKIQEK